MADGTDATVLCKQSLAVMTSPVSAFVDMRFIEHHRSQTPNVFFYPDGLNRIYVTHGGVKAWRDKAATN